MPNFDLKQQPQYPIRVMNTDTPISLCQLHEAFDTLDAITLCIRSNVGHTNRGGFFFCIKRDQSTDQMILESIEGDIIDIFSSNNMVTFINHVSGLQFNKEILIYCQNHINFRTD